MVDFLSQFLLGFFLCSSYSCLAQSNVELKSVSQGKMETFVSLIKLEGITFHKRSQNASPISTSISFELKSDTPIGTVSPSWLRNGKQIETIPDEIYSSENISLDKTKMNITLHLRDAAIVPGNYILNVTMGSSSVTASGAVVSAPILPSFHKPKRVLEGDIFRIVCSVSGHPRPAEVFWLFAPISIGQTEDDGALTSALRRLQPLDVNTSRYSRTTSGGDDIHGEGVLHDTLDFKQLLISDNGLYACNTSNSEGSDITLLLVNVKDRWAALWPFVGIVAEVIVLVIAILMFERHQMRSKPSSTATVQPPTGKPVTGDNSTAAANAGEYPPPVATATGNKLRTLVQPPDSVPKQATGTNAVDSVAVEVGAADSQLDSTEEPKQDELRLRGSTTKC